MKPKRCYRCKETKLVSEFGNNRSKKDGLCDECKSCRSEYKRRYYKANKEKLNEKSSRYREANKEKIAAKSRKYYEANKEKILENDRKYREANKERIAERRKVYREANKEKIREARRKYRRENGNQQDRASIKALKQSNDRSLELAYRNGLPWEDWEDGFVLAENGLTNYQKAVKLGRSLYSIKTRKRALIKKSRNELTHDKVRV